MITKLLKSKARKLPATVRIGKSGLSETVIGEVKRQLKKDKLVKVKFFKSAFGEKDKKYLFKELAEKTNSEIIYSVGFAVVLCRK